MRLRLKVIPKSSKDRIAGWLGDRLKIAVRAAPERGRANEAVIAVLSDALELPQSRIRILAGHSQALKTVELEGADEASISARLPAR